MADHDVNVQVRFTIHDNESGMDFTDALYYPLASWPVPDAQVEADKQARFAAWKEAVSAPTPEVVPDTPEDRRAQATDLAQRAQDLAAQAAALAEGVTADGGD